MRTLNNTHIRGGKEVKKEGREGREIVTRTRTKSVRTAMLRFGRMPDFGSAAGVGRGATTDGSGRVEVEVVVSRVGVA